MKDNVEHYRKILELLEKRLEIKHGIYGSSYVGKTESFMLHRLEGEIYELKKELYSQEYNYDKIIDEACDVAIVALLIGNQARLKKEELFGE